MSDGVDIGREAVEHLAAEIAAGCAAMDEHGENGHAQTRAVLIARGNEIMRGTA